MNHAGDRRAANDPEYGPERDPHAHMPRDEDDEEAGRSTATARGASGSLNTGGDRSSVQGQPGSGSTTPTVTTGRLESGDPPERVFDSVHGQTIDRYLVMETLGEGGMGAVYAAFDPDLDRRVAIKLLRARHSKKHRKRLEREARALARLSHPNIVQVYDVGLHQGDVFVTMELVDGQSLKDWSRTSPEPSWRRILDAYLDAARGIAAMHAQGLIHRDIKPANILIGRDGRVRIADFGLAAARKRRGESTDGEPSGEPSLDASGSFLVTASEFQGSVDQRLTRTGALMGTPAFMAPEQHVAGDVGPTADQYSLCAAIYEGIYGVLPFKPPRHRKRKDELAELLRFKYEGKLTPPPAGSKVPKWVRHVLLRGLSADPDQRFPSMLGLIAAFEAVPRRRRRLALVAIILASIIAAMAVVYAFVPARERPKSTVEKVVHSIVKDQISAIEELPAEHPCRLLDAELARLGDDELARRVMAKTTPLPGSPAERAARWSPCPADRREHVASPCALALTAPRAGSDVSDVVEVNGTAKVPPHAHVWTLITLPELFAGKPLSWWPQEPAVVSDSDTWRATASLGSPDDIGKEFAITAILVNDFTHLRLWRYRCEVEMTKHWKAIPLPSHVWGPRTIRVRKVEHQTAIP